MEVESTEEAVMKVLDRTFSTPEENLACDEALLDSAEENGQGEVIRFWESDSVFVVLGSSNHAGTEVRLDNCRRDGIPVLRRRSGGGAVLQGPGCLNYCLVIRMDGLFSTIAGTNKFVLERHATILSSLLGQPVRHQGSTDLTIGDRKISGNSQRRRLRFLLFHGTFLVRFDIGLIGEYLKRPSKEPDYRKNRMHEEFLMNISLTTQQIKAEMKRVWQALEEEKRVPERRIANLVSSRYGSHDWNFRL